jgi:hypothetical protein
MYPADERVELTAGNGVRLVGMLTKPAATIGREELLARWFREYMAYDPAPDSCESGVRCSRSRDASTSRWIRTTSSASAGS